MSNGAIMQWGSNTVAADSQQTFNFPTTFPSNCYGFAAGSRWYNANGWTPCNGSPISNSQYYLFNIVEYNQTVWWVAMGY